MQAQTGDVKDWSIADYFKNLPEKYITASGDFFPRSEETAVVDEKNGYAAYLNRPMRSEMGNDPPYPIFEMAFFKSQTKLPLVVVANLKSDEVCNEYETFFLRRFGNDWSEVSREVLPPINLKMFWGKPQSAVKLLKIVERDHSTTYHFEPPRAGTRMKVSLEICKHFLKDAPNKQFNELSKLIESARPIYLDWDKQNGKFKIAK